MNSPYLFVVRHPRTVITICVVVTILSCLQLAIRRVKLDGSPETLIIKSDQSSIFYNETLKNFGDDRIILAVVESDDLFSTAKMAKLRTLTQELANVSGVQRAIGLTSVQYVRNVDDTIKVSNLVPRDATAADLTKIKSEIVTDPLFRGQLISADGKTTAINLFLHDDQDDATRRALATSVEEKLESYRGQFKDVYVTGEPIMRLHGTMNMRRDLFLFIPITILLIAVVFFISFRTIGGVLLPLMAISMAVIWTVGLMSLLNKPLTVVTLSLPAVILAIGSSYIVHVINQYYISTAKLGSGQGIEERRRAVFDALSFIKGPVLVSGTITMAGFLSLATGEIQGSRDMGYFAAFGMLASTLLALTFVPAVLILLHTPASRKGDSSYASYLDGILRTLGRIATERQKTVYLVTGALCLVSLYGFTKIEVNTDYRAFFKKSSPVYQATEKVHKNLAGCATFELVLDGGRSGAVMQPQVLDAMKKMQQFSIQNGADAAFSYSDIVTVVNRAVTSNPTADLPTDKMALDNLDKDYLSQDEDASHLITADRSKAVVLIRTDFYGSNQMRDFLEKVENYARTSLPQTFKVNTTGIFVLLNHASDSVASQQATSLTVAMLLILAMVTVLFKSVKLGIIAIIPNTIPILFTFGFMGWSGITLDINTSLVASIVLGLAVDNAVHFIIRFARNRVISSGNKEAVILSLTQSGKPIIFANLTLVFAFAIFILSQFNPIQISGMLSSVAIFACMIGNLLFLPVLLTSYAVKAKDGVPTQSSSAKSEHQKTGTREEEITIR